MCSPSRPMSNLLEPHKQEEILALGRLGWTLTRIGRATGVHRVTVGSTCAGRASDPRSGSAWRRSNDTGNFRGGLALGGAARLSAFPGDDAAEKRSAGRSAEAMDRPFELEDDRPLFAHGPGVGLSPERGAPRWVGPHCWTQPVQLDPSSIKGGVTANVTSQSVSQLIRNARRSEGAWHRVLSGNDGSEAPQRGGRGRWRFSIVEVPATQ